MDMTEYQHFTRTTAAYPESALVTYPALGLAGETGEVCEHIKKSVRDDGGIVSDERKEKLKKELGDVMWYIARLADDLGFDLSDIATINVSKLNSRQSRNVIHGSGDDR